ncbi:MAG: hypothetical protein HY537_15200, partial [Deltaproteobacteria bacterium]|nr:hypothetical protein [Deltaproteobacteria bacterium]
MRARHQKLISQLSLLCALTTLSFTQASAAEPLFCGEILARVIYQYQRGLIGEGNDPYKDVLTLEDNSYLKGKVDLENVRKALWELETDVF